MDFRPDMDAHLAAKKRMYTKKRKRTKALLVSLLIITIIAVWTLIGFIAYRLLSSNTPTPPTPAETTADKGFIPEETYAPMTVATEPPKTMEVTFSRDDTKRGSLILVSFTRDNEFDFSLAGDFMPLYGNKSQSYRISSTALTLHSDTVAAFNEMFDAYQSETGNKDYQITQASRTFDEQKSIYDSYLETYGVEVGSSLAAVPGYSEHHSGYAVDMNVYTADGISYSVGSAAEVNPIYGWIYDNCAKYGFVLRYPEGKTEITGITNEPWHFRYVGKGHAAYMAEHSLVLEEYIDLLYSYQFGKKHLEFSYDGVNYEVALLQFDDNEETKTITLEKDTCYTVSGNNEGGVIITIVK
nr:M15 family metallopeptidase [Clostridia bacterium]